jgi:hypothetical protein
LNNAITDLWDEFCLPSWRDAESGVPPGTNKVIENPDATNHMNKYSEAETLERPPAEDEVDFVYIKSRVKARRGKWRMISQDIIDAENKKKTDSSN